MGFSFPRSGKKLGFSNAQTLTWLARPEADALEQAVVGAVHSCLASVRSVVAAWTSRKSLTPNRVETAHRVGLADLEFKLELVRSAVGRKALAVPSQQRSGVYGPCSNCADYRIGRSRRGLCSERRTSSPSGIVRVGPELHQVLVNK